MPKPKYTITNVRDLVKSLDGQLLSEDYRITSDRVKIRCNGCNKTWEPQFCELLRGSRCPTCSQAKYSTDDIVQKIYNKGGTILSELYQGSTSITVRCKKGHIWESSWGKVLVGSWCPECSGCAKNTVEYVRAKLLSKNIKLLAPKYNSTKQYLKVRCMKCNHVWAAMFCKLRNQNGCPSCAGNIKYSQLYVRIEIESRGGRMLSGYAGMHDKLTVQCNICSEIWNPTLSSVKRGSWCPSCACGKAQTKLTKILREIYKDAIIYKNYNKFEWLKTVRSGKQQIDILIKSKDGGVVVGVEYDGEQHFKPVRFGGIDIEKAKSNLKNVRRLDKIKNAKIKKHKDDIHYFIRFSYVDKIDAQSVKKKLLRNKIVIF